MSCAPQPRAIGTNIFYSVSFACRLHQLPDTVHQVDLRLKLLATVSNEGDKSCSNPLNTTLMPPPSAPTTPADRSAPCISALPPPYYPPHPSSYLFLLIPHCLSGQNPKLQHFLLHPSRPGRCPQRIRRKQWEVKHFRMSRLNTPLKPYSARSSSVLPGSTDLFTLQLPLSCDHVTVRMRRKGGDPLLMIRCNEPPRVPRRSKVVADAWDQASFDADATDHSVTLQLTPGGGPGKCPSAHPCLCDHSLDAGKRQTHLIHYLNSSCRRLQLHGASERDLLLHADSGGQWAGTAQRNECVHWASN